MWANLGGSLFERSEPIVPHSFFRTWVNCLDGFEPEVVQTCVTRFWSELQPGAVVGVSLYEGECMYHGINVTAGAYVTIACAHQTFAGVM